MRSVYLRFVSPQPAAALGTDSPGSGTYLPTRRENPNEPPPLRHTGRKRSSGDDGARRIGTRPGTARGRGSGAADARGGPEHRGSRGETRPPPPRARLRAAPGRRAPPQARRGQRPRGPGNRSGRDRGEGEPREASAALPPVGGEERRGGTARGPVPGRERGPAAGGRPEGGGAGRGAPAGGATPPTPAAAAAAASRCRAWAAAAAHHVTGRRGRAPREALPGAGRRARERFRRPNNAVPSRRRGRWRQP